MIYVISPGKVVTGGPETLHQFAGLLAELGQEVGMYYLAPHTMTVPQRYQKYSVPVVDAIVDSEENILIIPETMTFVLGRYKKIRKCIWWLSWDNYFKSYPKHSVNDRMEKYKLPQFLFPAVYVLLILKRKIYPYHYFYQFNDGGEIFHLYNCEYAHQKLLEYGILEERTLYLCGPLNHSFFERAERIPKTARENVILYNPKKGLDFTQKLIRQAKERKLPAEFIAIQGMTPDQIAKRMSTAKIYIDFGNFPGPERMPREAVTMGCNIITSRNGAAANDVDVPIPDELKFAETEEQIPAILDRLEDMLNNYEKYYPQYDAYREKVRNQVPLLQENTKRFLEMI